MGVFRRLAARGDDSAALELARAELLGLGTRRDVPRALRRLRRVARRDSTVTPLEREQAMLLAASVLADGWLVPRDHRGALRWLRRAAAAGSAAGRGWLADLGEAP